MKKKEFKEALINLLNSDVDRLEKKELIKYTRSLIFKLEEEEDFDTSNKGKPWTDEELRIVLSFAPTKENSLKLAKAFKRSYGSIEQIFRWATTTNDEISAKGREEDSFIQQIKRLYKELGWRA
ncbi:hypothetical protein [Paenibacillus qinlingensis]|uniref:hypothetical protein n=1 Tax=Paenibacillus qinlingensis TaxID=1837343 RepID=UPI001565935F|nr:hypothetical protein [Paenibacillus qinlingensis]NQX61777.1 hypothetical protein [Paenibacillus qinlingensis]